MASVAMPTIKSSPERPIRTNTVMLNGVHAILMSSFCKQMRNSLYYNDVIMRAMASQITSLAIVYSTVYSEADQRKHQSSASLACVRGIHMWPVNSPHKWPVTWKMFSSDDVIMKSSTIIIPKNVYKFRSI